MKRWISLAVMVSVSGFLAFVGPVHADQGESFKDKAQSAWSSAQVLGKRVSHSVVAAWKVIRKTSDRLTDKFIGKMSQPLDRSAADKKAALSNTSLYEANKVSAAAATKAKAANQEIYKLKNEGFGLYSSSSSGSSSKSKGRFTSLD